MEEEEFNDYNENYINNNTNNIDQFNNQNNNYNNINNENINYQYYSNYDNGNVNHNYQEQIIPSNANKNTVTKINQIYNLLNLYDNISLYSHKNEQDQSNIRTNNYLVYYP